MSKWERQKLIDFGRRVRLHRKRLALSALGLASKMQGGSVGELVKRVGEIERGEAEPTPAEMRTLAGIFDITEDQLLGRS